MKKIFYPKTKYEKFCKKILDALVENSRKTYICGGTSRDILLNKKLYDFDIATNISSNTALKILQTLLFSKNIKTVSYYRFGVIKIFFTKALSIDISSFRKEAYTKPSYPIVHFTQSLQTDSKRRDFTINSLYISPKNGSIIDLNNGINDLNNKIIRFIGNPKKRILEDPIRILRALRLSLTLNFKIEKKAWETILESVSTIKIASNKKIVNELRKLHNKKQRRILEDIFFKKKSLDKFANKFYDD